MPPSALRPVRAIYIGYEKAAKCAKKAYQENTSLKDACLTLGYLSEEEFDHYVNPEQMV